jgi:hypothetical protein
MIHLRIPNSTLAWMRDCFKDVVKRAELNNVHTGNAVAKEVIEFFTSDTRTWKKVHIRFCTGAHSRQEG